MTFTHAVSTDNYGPAKWIVDASAANGTHTTIAAALTSASSGDTIFIRPGTYTENLTLKAGVNLTAFVSDAQTPNVTIIGKCTATFAGSATLSGIRLQTNSDNCVSVTGSAATIINLFSCYINCSNNTGILNSSSSGSSLVFCSECTGDIGTVGIAIFSNSGGGGLKFNSCIFTNSGGSTTANTCSGTSSGALSAFDVQFNSALTLSSAASILLEYCQFTILTSSGTSSGTVLFCYSSDVVIGAGTTITLCSCIVNSASTNVLTGAGTLNYAFIAFNGASSGHNVTTENALATLI